MYIKYFLRSQNIFSCPGSVSFTIEADEVVLVCQAAGFPSDLSFWWEKANDTYTEPVAGDERPVLPHEDAEQVLAEAERQRTS